MNRRSAFFFLCMLFSTQLLAADTGLAEDKAMANIAFSKDKSKGWTREFSVTAVGVDGKFVLNLWNLRRGLKVTAGAHSFILKASFGRGFYRSLGVGFAEVSAKLQAGGQYKAMGSVNGDRISVWIIESRSGKQVSNVGSKKYELCFPTMKEPC
jgi:hypothetical protein